jgi:hypothetical protein
MNAKLQSRNLRPLRGLRVYERRGRGTAVAADATKA